MLVCVGCAWLVPPSLQLTSFSVAGIVTGKAAVVSVIAGIVTGSAITVARIAACKAVLEYGVDHCLYL